MARMKYKKPAWAEGTSLTPKFIRRISNHSYSLLMLKEARRLQLLQRQENKKLISAARLRGDLSR